MIEVTPKVIEFAKKTPQLEGTLAVEDIPGFLEVLREPIQGLEDTCL